MKWLLLIPFLLWGNIDQEINRYERMYQSYMTRAERMRTRADRIWWRQFDIARYLYWRACRLEKRARCVCLELERLYELQAQSSAHVTGTIDGSL